MKVTLPLLSALALGTTAVTAQPTTLHAFARRDVSAATAAIQKAYPKTASCSAGANADECATAADAAPHIIQAFVDYKISNPNEWAALLSIMAFESGSFKFNRNHFPAPGRPGQGTRNMQMAPSQIKFVADLASKGKLDKAKVAAAGSDPNKVLALVLPNQFSFASAAWYYSSQCEDGVKKGVQSGTQAGYEAYLTKCVQTTSTPDRIDGWNQAMKVVK